MMKGDDNEWRLGEILLQQEWVSWDNMQKALEMQADSGNLKRGILRDRKCSVFYLGELLVKHDWVTWDGLKQGLRIQKASGRLLGSILVEHGLTSRPNLYRALALQSNMTYVDFTQIAVQPEAVDLVPKEFAYEHQVMPLVAKDHVLLIAISDPMQIQAEMDLRKIVSEYEIKTVLSCPDEIEATIERYYGSVDKLRSQSVI